jgi:hypothetical protein
MRATRASTDEAVSVYILATAYLHNTQIDNLIPANRLHVQEKWASVFYIWRRDESSTQDDQPVETPPSAPIAMCIYKPARKIWTVELSSGEKLAIRDKGTTWDIVGEVEKKPERGVVKRGMRWYRAKGHSDQTRRLGT